MADTDTTRHAAAIRAELPRLLSQIEQIVSIDSPTDAPDGVAAVTESIAAELVAAEFQLRRHTFADTGPAIEATRRFGAGPRILILGHTDTVWPVGTASTWPFATADGTITGPGVGDMKSNLVMACAALRRFADGPNAAKLGTITMLLVPDEEAGSPSSRGLIEHAARTADVCLCLEPGRPGGGIVISRGAVGVLRICARGISAHTTDPAGRSAVTALAKLVGPLEALTRREEGIIATVGTFTGGSARQVVPESAEAVVDLRAPSDDAATRLLTQIDQLLAKMGTPGVTITSRGGFTRPAYPPTDQARSLFRIAAEASASLGVAAFEVHEQGGSDASFTGALGVPTLDGLGPITHDPCSRRERVETPSIADRAAILTRLLEAIARGETTIERRTG